MLSTLCSGGLLLARMGPDHMNQGLSLFGLRFTLPKMEVVNAW